MAEPAAAVETESWPIDRPQPYERNPRKISEAAVAKVAESIRLFGWRQPIVVDEAGVILIGHVRHRAARQLGLAEVPVHIARGLSPAQAKALRLADNRTGEESDWAEDLLRIELDDLKGLDFDLDGLGFDASELDELFEDPGGGQARALGSLAEKFGAPPFSVLNAREGWWQDRKRAWIATGIESELGRGENLLRFSDTVLEPDPAKRAKRKAAKG